MKITLRKNDLLKTLLEVFEETDRTGAEGIEIEIEDNKLHIAIIECGGLGCCDDFEPIHGLSQNEIDELP